MKLYGALCVAVAIVMLLTPLVSVSFRNTDMSEENATENYAVSDVTASVNTVPQQDDSISVFITADKSIDIMEMRDYIIGTVAAEVPASYETEAIKAQALAAVTFAEYRKSLGGDSSIDGAIISDDSSRHQGYISVEEMKIRWGDAFDVYYAKISDAVDEVIDKVIVYQDEPIMAAYHAISSGKTESAANMWGADVPYLRSVDSSWDEDSTRYESNVVIAPDELAEIMGVDISEVYVKTKSTSSSGTVLEIELCSVSMTGMEVRELLGLRSPVFTVVKEEGEYIFTSKGYGHGVGMSQNGANCMALDGYSCEEIIKHYFNGVEIVQR